MDSRWGHLSEEQLIDFREDDPSQQAATHLASCAHCRQRLQDLRAACAAYEEYRTSVHERLLPPAPQPWPRLSALVARQEREDRRYRFRWWPAAALAATVGFAVILGVMRQTGHDSSREAERILTRSSAVALPEGRAISLRMHGRTLIRPAVLKTDSTGADDPEMERLRGLFVSASYSWEEPLSARSFLQWRNRLGKRRDEVSIVHSGISRAYRVRTENPAGPLRAASLMLREHDMRPTEGSFDFEGEDSLLEMAETPTRPEVLPESRKESAIARQTEAPAGPEDTLRVLVALRQIGADVDDPITVAGDGHAVVVRGQGVSLERQQEIAAVLQSVPRVRLDFNTPMPASTPVENQGERHSTSIPRSIRRKLEDHFGGPMPAQQAIDTVLDEGASLISHVRAIEDLALKFPEPVEAQLSPPARRDLELLCTDHLARTEEFLDRIEKQLRPLVALTEKLDSPQPAQEDFQGSWQVHSHLLANAGAALNELLNRFLAGSYTEEEGERMLRRLDSHLSRLRKAILTQRKAAVEERSHARR